MENRKSPKEAKEEALKLRKRSGAGIFSCLKALRATGYDQDKAFEWLKDPDNYQDPIHLRNVK